MGRLSSDSRMRRIAATALAVSLSVAAGAGIAAWAVADTNGFYMAPIDRYGIASDTRGQPVSDSFWREQDGELPAKDQAVTTSTATSAQPAYRSASGS